MTSHTDRAESNDDGENPINRTLYVHSLAPKATEEELTELFMQVPYLYIIIIRINVIL